MLPLRNLSISKKIVVITMIISSSALLLAGGALTTYDYVATRRDLRQNTLTLSRIIADNSIAAVSFNDPATAIETLNALRAEPSIIAACIYTGMNLFAEHLSSPAVAHCSSQAETRAQDNNDVFVTSPIEFKGKNIGTVRLRANLEPANARLRLEIATIAGILLLSAFFAFGLSAVLQKLVSNPILSLSVTADEISRRKDYSLRAVRQSSDELGTLVDSFNEMLDQIRRREAELEERTADLAKAHETSTKANEALAKVNEDLEKANKMKDEFLATISHELRTPLTSIFGWVNMLQAGKLDETKTQKAIDVIYRNVRAQMQIVDDLLNVSQIITGKLKIRPEWTDAGTIIHTAVDSIQPAASAKAIVVFSEIADPAEPVFVDPERIQQVLWNLLSNAIKFSDNDAQVKIECGRVGTKLQISVSDTGEGIDPSFIPFLFERFTQADASMTRKHGGLGLGLAITRHIVESHGGTIMVHSLGKGQGATFIVQLPVPALRPESAALSPTKTASLQGLRVLLVEDEFDTREMVAEGLEQAGATMLLSASGAEALGILSRQQPDVIVSDIGMPEMDGFEFLKRVRSQSSPRLRTLPAIALTAFAGERDQKHAFRAGYQAYLVKPVEISELISVIASIAIKSDLT